MRILNVKYDNVMDHCPITSRYTNEEEQPRIGEVFRTTMPLFSHGVVIKFVSVVT